MRLVTSVVGPSRTLALSGVRLHYRLMVLGMGGKLDRILAVLKKLVGQRVTLENQIRSKRMHATARYGNLFSRLFEPGLRAVLQLSSGVRRWPKLRDRGAPPDRSGASAADGGRVIE
jgi:hypothetical protein